jgi:hypothetical protein
VSGLYAVELRVPADNSWALEAQRAFRDALARADRPELLPSVKAEGGSGSGELVLRWVDLEATAAWAATRAALDVAVEILPALAEVRFLTLAAEALDPNREARRPLGA